MRTNVPEQKPVALTILACFLILSLAVVGLASDEPTPWSPYPGVQFLLYTAGLPIWVARLLPPVVYIGLLVALTMAPQPLVDRVTAGSMGVLSVLTVAYFATRVRAGLSNQGFVHVAFVAAANLFAILSFWFLRNRSQNRGSSRRTLLLAFVLFSWLTWIAFPYFGEGI